MRSFFLLVLVAVFVTGCNLEKEVNTAKDNISHEKVWVFAQFNVPYEGGGFQDYYYYGRVSKPLYIKIKNNRTDSGFILMDDVMFWGNDDLIHEYADVENEGEIVFRIEDIRKMELVNVRPKAGMGSEQFEKQNRGGPNSSSIPTTPADKESPKNGPLEQ